MCIHPQTSRKVVHSQANTLLEIITKTNNGVHSYISIVMQHSEMQFCVSDLLKVTVIETYANSYE